MKNISRKPVLSIALFIPFLLLIFLKIFLQDLLLKPPGIPIKIYMLITITMVCLIPMIVGLVYGIIFSDDKRYESENESDLNVNSLYLRSFAAFSLSIVLTGLFILILKPVPSQGWLRTVYAAILISVQASLYFIFIATTVNRKIEGRWLPVFFWILLIVLPVGLLLHHPWNIIAFFSPYYWLAWAWMIQSPFQSLICGIISMVITAMAIILLFHYYSGKNKE